MVNADEIFQALEDHPVTARISMYRIEKDGREVRLPIVNKRQISARHENPRRYETFELPGGIAMARRYYSTQTKAQYEAPRGTPDSATLVMSFAAAAGDGTRGTYRLQVETLEDIPALSGVTSFLVYEEVRVR